MTPAERQRRAQVRAVIAQARASGLLMVDYQDSHPALARAERRARRIERWGEYMLALVILITAVVVAAIW